jgi:hypothetical protein
MIILGTNSIKDTGYDVANSCRFDDGSSAYMSRTLGTPTDPEKWTWSCWVKRSTLGATQTLFSYDSGGTLMEFIGFNSTDSFRWYHRTSGGTVYHLNTNRLFRDVSAFYHLLVVYDSSQGTDSNRVKFFVNGTQETSFATSSYPAQDLDSELNKANAVKIYSWNGSEFFDGYIAENVFCDGQAYTTTDFGEFDEDSGIWKPKDVSGLTFGTNGFYLDFENSGSLGADVSGNGNNFTVNNLTSIDQSTDTCTLNMTTANPLHFNATIPSAGTLSDGNLTFTSSQGSGGYPAMYSTMAVSQGKWYAEFKVTTGNSAIVGIGAGSLRGGFFGGGYYDYAYYYDGTFYNNGGNTGSQSSYTDGDIISVAMDLDNNKVYVAKNNTWQHSGNPSAGSGGYTITAPASQTDATGTGVYHFAYGDAGGGTPAIQGNFGSPPYSSNGNSDANGYGNMTYSVPTGFFILNSKNLAEFG